YSPGNFNSVPPEQGRIRDESQPNEEGNCDDRSARTEGRQAQQKTPTSPPILDQYHAHADRHEECSGILFTQKAAGHAATSQKPEDYGKTVCERSCFERELQGAASEQEGDLFHPQCAERRLKP